MAAMGMFQRIIKPISVESVVTVEDTAQKSSCEIVAEKLLHSGARERARRLRQMEKRK